MRLKKYHLGFDLWGLGLFLVLMVPNFIWFAVPAPHDVLRADSITGAADAIAAGCQVLMAAALCFLVNKERPRLQASPLTMATAGCCLLYFISWGFYYSGAVSPPVILGLTVFPCLAFLFFAIDRKNRVALIPISGFTICHLIYSVVNFIVPPGLV